MRVILATPDFPPQRGGIQLLLDRLVTHSRFTYEVVTVAASADKTECGSPAVTRARPWPDHRLEILQLNALALLRARRWRPDAIVSGHIVCGPAATIAQSVLGVPALQYLHAKELSRRPRIARTVLARSSAAIAVSSYTRELGLRHGADGKRMHVIWPGVDLPSVPPPALLVRPGPPTIVTVARLHDRYKGFDVMLRALPLVRTRVPDVRWVLIGEGPLRHELQETADKRGLRGSCLFTGALSDDERDAWLDRSHVFAMPSRLNSAEPGGEGFGIVYLEAGAHRLPCVAGDAGGSVDAVIDNQTGLRVDASDHRAVADAIARLIEDSELASRLGEEGRRRAGTLTWRRMASAVDDVIEQVVRSASHGPAWTDRR
jgi:phosphatidylinositol alpha-1,6-mannosyltransferase